MILNLETRLSVGKMSSDWRISHSFQLLYVSSHVVGAASQQRNLPPRLDKNAPQQKNIPPRLDKPTQSQQKVPSPRSPDNGGWDDDDDIGFSDLSGISSQIRYNIQKVIVKKQDLG